MVRKLIKYDFASFLRLILPVQLILLGIAALNRIIQLFEDSHATVYNIIFGSSTVLYVISIIVALVLTWIVAIVRFYQGMYSNEGYLSHTLPVTPTQHIFSKLIVSMLFMLGTLFTVFISFIIVTLGEMNIEIFKAGGFLFGKAVEATNGAFIWYFIEFCVLMLIGMCSGFLCIYFCISVGQLAAKRKILLAFGVFFGLYFIGQVIGTIMIIIMSVIDLRGLYDWITNHFVTFYHLMFCGGIVLEIIMAAVYFLITKFIMGKKLNLT